MGTQLLGCKLHTRHERHHEVCKRVPSEVVHSSIRGKYKIDLTSSVSMQACRRVLGRE